jgi:glycosyltransferase involved in cell wall biosynthesis
MTKPINVLQFICPTGFYGAERWILALSRFLPSERVRCDLAVTLEENSRDLDIVRLFREKHGEAFELPMKHRFDFKVIDQLVKLIHERDIDIIHTHGYKSDILGVIAARKAGIKCVVTPHGFENARDFKLRFFIWLGCKAMGFADKVAPLSRQLMDESAGYGVPTEKLTYIQNGVDLSEVDAQREQPVKHRGDGQIKRIGFIGQMISRKNIFDILKIFDELHSKNPQTRLILVGDGEQRAELESFAATLSCVDAIDFLGFRNDRLELLQSFDLFVMTSTLEGIPRCLMEACAMEIPVAAYDIPGIDQLIEHGKTGLLARPADRQSLLEHWKKLLFDETYAHELASNAHQYVERHYSAQRMANEYATLFEQLTGKPDNG